MTDHEIKLFESVQVRSHWDAAQEKWYFSVVDAVQVVRHLPHSYTLGEIRLARAGEFLNGVVASR